MAESKETGNVDAAGLANVTSTQCHSVGETSAAAGSSDKHFKEVARILLDDQYYYVWGMVVYQQRVYLVYGSGLTVHCYTPDGSLSHKYNFHPFEVVGRVSDTQLQNEENDGANDIRGMCLIMDGDTAMLVISDYGNKNLVWINISDDVTMEQLFRQPLNYGPCGSRNDGGNLMVCDPDNHRIHRYTHDGQTLAVINLPDDVNPWWVARHGDREQYVVSDYIKNQVVIINKEGQVNNIYNGEIDDVELGWPRDVITDPHRGVLIADHYNNQVLLLRRTGDVVKILDQHVRSPDMLYLNTDHHRLYVSGEDQCGTKHVFLFTF